MARAKKKLHADGVVITDHDNKDEEGMIKVVCTSLVERPSTCKLKYDCSLRSTWLHAAYVGSAQGRSQHEAAERATLLMMMMIDGLRKQRPPSAVLIVAR